VALGKSDGVDEVVREAVALHVAAGREALLQAASVPAEQFPAAVESCVGTWQRPEVLKYLGGFNGKH
jgi:hypothetical protein